MTGVNGCEDYINCCLSKQCHYININNDKASKMDDCWRRIGICEVTKSSVHATTKSAGGAYYGTFCADSEVATQLKQKYPNIINWVLLSIEIVNWATLAANINPYYSYDSNSFDIMSDISQTIGLLTLRFTVFIKYND